MFKGLAALFLTLYLIIASVHGIWFVGQAKYNCIKQIGFTKGLFRGCDKIYLDPVNRVVHDSFYKNFYRGLIWPAHYFGGEEKQRVDQPLSLKDKAFGLSEYLNRTFSETDNVKSLVTRVELSSLNRFVFEIEWDPKQFESFEEMPVEFFKSRLVANICSQLEEDNNEARSLKGILQGGYNLLYIFTAEGVDQKVEVEIESCYPSSYF